MTFINTIISYLSKNGTIDVSMLYSSPFIDINHEGIDGVFDIEKKKKVVRLLIKKTIMQLHNPCTLKN